MSEALDLPNGGSELRRSSPELLRDPAKLPLGAHGLSFHASRDEATEHAVSFLAGNPPGKAASYWVPDTEQESLYNERLAEAGSDQVGCVRALDGPQVAEEHGRLRPVEPIRQFIAAHPEGVTAAGETISLYWTPETVPGHMEYEAWFQAQPRGESRFLCPYDLRRVPPEMAADVMRDLGSHHSHVILSPSNDPAVRLLQLFIFRTASQLPSELRSTLAWAEESGLVVETGPERALQLTAAGDGTVRSWSEHVVVDW